MSHKKPSTPKEYLIDTVHDLFSARNKLSDASTKIRNKKSPSWTLNKNDLYIAEGKYATMVDLLSSIHYEATYNKKCDSQEQDEHEVRDQFNKIRQSYNSDCYADKAEKRLVDIINGLDENKVISILSSLSKTIDTILSAEKSSHQISSNSNNLTLGEKNRVLSTPTLNLWYFDFLAKLGQKIQMALGCKTSEEKLLNNFQNTAKELMKNNRSEEKAELTQESLSEETIKSNK